MPATAWQFKRFRARFMMRKHVYFFTTAICILLLGNFNGSRVLAQSPQSVDAESGLIEALGWLEVKATCTECHSAQMITQTSGNRSVWKSRIEWMQETQGLGLLSDSQENTILTYLAENYGQKESSRRSAIPAHLMPINPLGSVE
jgi:hypothetical protein